MFDSLVPLMLTLGAVMAILGATRIYYLWSHGKPDIEREVVMWVGGILFLVLIPITLRLIQ
jgi:hypothetical protein